MHVVHGGQLLCDRGPVGAERIVQFWLLLPDGFVDAERLYLHGRRILCVKRGRADRVRAGHL